MSLSPWNRYAHAVQRGRVSPPTMATMGEQTLLPFPIEQDLPAAPVVAATPELLAALADLLLQRLRRMQEEDRHDA